MDSNDLQRLAGHLDKRGLQAAVGDSMMRLNATNRLNSRLTEESLTERAPYVTGFDHVLGERGHERVCARRIARMRTVVNAATGAATGPANRLPTEAHR